MNIMKKITRINSRALPIRTENIDTDQIIPAKFLKTTRKTGIGQYLFYHWRFDSKGGPMTDSVFSQSNHKEAKILLAGKNFGCGSSREHAVWALQDYGFEAIISSSFGDIFRTNSLKNGLLTIQLSEAEMNEIFELFETGLTHEIHIHLARQEIRIPTLGKKFKFAIDPFRKKTLLEGVDELEYILGLQDKILKYEKNHNNFVTL